MISWTLGGVDKLRLQDLAFFDHLPPSVYIFYGIKVYKKLIFLTTYPPSLVNVVCEWPIVGFTFYTSPLITKTFLGKGRWSEDALLGVWGWNQWEIVHCNAIQGQYRARTGFSLCSFPCEKNYPGKTLFLLQGWVCSVLNLESVRIMVWVRASCW